jgi:hypothetical protein
MMRMCGLSREFGTGMSAIVFELFFLMSSLEFFNKRNQLG